MSLSPITVKISDPVHLVMLDVIATQLRMKPTEALIHLIEKTYKKPIQRHR